MTWMKYTVKCMYCNGVRLSCSQIAEAVSHTGLVVIEEAPRGPFSHIARKARLFDAAEPESRRDTIPPLFDAEMLGLDRSHTIIHGYQLHIDLATGAVRQDLQCWLISASPSH
jgi:hypothetical protein